MHCIDTLSGLSAQLAEASPRFSSFLLAKAGKHRFQILISAPFVIMFPAFPGKCRDNILEQVTTASFLVLSNSLSPAEPTLPRQLIKCHYIN